MNDLLKVKIELLKDAPGVYIMKNKDAKVIYVGKAKSLIKRVKQYFYREQFGKVKRMVREIEDFDTIEINSEKESLLLEINLIQKYYPKYNILLKDGKSYPYISLSKDDEPVLKVAYKATNQEKYEYFGPYPSIGSAYKVIDLLNKIFPLRKCNHIPSTPCLYYHLGECLGPCINRDLKSQYGAMVNQIKSFLENPDDNELKNNIKAKMLSESEKLNFEKAQEYKEILSAIDYIKEKQHIDLKTKEDIDVIATSSREGYLSLSIITYRHGMLLGKNSFVEEKEDDEENEILSLIYQYYLHHDLPKNIVIGNEILAASLEEVYNAKIIVPQQGEKHDLLLIGLENAKNALDEHFLSARLNDNNLELLERLGNILSLPVPLRIELFDNSHLQGEEPIGAMVVFINGEKCPSMYRKFNIRESSGKDDLASMYEVIKRRYSRLKEENQSYPDLILVDGGQNQINVTLMALKEIDVFIPVAGLVKDDHHHTSNLLYQGELHPLKNDDKLFLMLVRMQDEVHRYAITFHRQKRGKKITNSFFDEIEGIGIKRKENLLKAYPSLESLKNASKEELMQLVPENVAEGIINKLNK